MTRANEAEAVVQRMRDGLTWLNELLSRLTDEELAEPMADGWTGSALLAHVAFWDGWRETTWRRYQRSGEFEDAGDAMQDIINAAAKPAWLALPPAAARELCAGAAASVVATIQALPAEATGAALAASRPWWVDRTWHWKAHLSELDRGR